MEIRGFSHAGNHRSENQDAFEFVDKVIVIADGMGGHPSGDIAAQIACKRIIEFATAQSTSRAVTNERLFRWFSEINQQLLSELPSSGTTCTLLLLFPTEYIVASVGDTRAYVFRDQKFVQLTTDQNLATTTGTGLNAHVLTNHLGKRDFAKPMIMRGAIAGGDRFILASDGAYSGNEALIVSELSRTEDIETTIASIDTELTDADPGDNFTIVLVEVPHG